MEQNKMLVHMQAISKEATSCTLVANKGERIEVEIYVIFSLKCLNLYFFMDIFHVQIFLFVVFLPLLKCNFQVQSFLLAAASPFLASLLSQAGNPSSIFLHTIFVII